MKILVRTINKLQADRLQALIARRSRWEDWPTVTEETARNMNHLLRNSLASFMILGFLVTGIAAQSVEKLEEKMSREEFRAAGLHRLSTEELEFLNRWLSPHTPEVASTSFGEEQLPAPPPDPEAADLEIVTRVSGDFTGWDGRTIFKLENGQIWQQRAGGKYHYQANRPEVTLKRGNFGYYMKILSTRRQVPFKRLQ